MNAKLLGLPDKSTQAAFRGLDTSRVWLLAIGGGQ